MAEPVLFTSEVSIEALRVLYGAEPCEAGCGTHVAFGRRVDDLDAEHPIVIARGFAEIEDVPNLGREHTAARCQALRSGHGP